MFTNTKSTTFVKNHLQMEEVFQIHLLQGLRKKYEQIARVVEMVKHF